VAFAFTFLAVFGAAAGAIGWNARHTYYVGFSGDRVAVYQGRPGGVLWFDPTVEQVTDILRSEVPDARMAELEAGVTEGSLAAAERYLENLRDQISPSTTSTTTSTSSSTSTSTSSTTSLSTTSSTVPAN
jgi:protein phosphatase